MKIGVISDTHMQRVSKELDSLACGLFADVSMVLHAGDLTRIAILDVFPEKEVVAVSGNMDQQDVTGILPVKQIVSVEGYRIGIVHGWGSSRGIEERIMGAFSDVHVIVYGHTHEPANHLQNGILLFNPGSFSGSHFRSGGRSVGMLTVEKGVGIHGEILGL